MKRVGNKSGQLVRSASRRNKTPCRFQFDLLVHAVHGLKPSGVYYIKWTRGVKVATSDSFTVPKDVSPPAPYSVDLKLNLLVTLYREEGKKFDPKEAKLSIVSATPKKPERTVAKTRFDLSSFAGAPNLSSAKVLKFSDKISIRTTVESKFLRAGPAGPGSNASSVMSGVDVGSDDGVDDVDEFGDLSLDDVPDPDFGSAAALPRTTRAVSNASSSGAGAGASAAAGAGPSSVGKTSQPAKLLSRKTTSPVAATAPRPSNDPLRTPMSSNAQAASRNSSSPQAFRRKDRSSIAVRPEGNTAASSTPSPTAASKSPSASTTTVSPVAATGVPVISAAATATTATPRAFVANSVPDNARFAELREQNERLSADLGGAVRQRDASDAEHRIEVDGLKAKVERQSADLADVARKLESMRTEHSREVAELRDVVAVKTRDFTDLTKRYEDATRMTADMRSKATELRSTVEQLTNELNAERQGGRSLEVDKERLRDKETELGRSVEELKAELVTVGRQREEMRMQVRRGEVAEARCKELSLEVDALTVAAARSSDAGGGAPDASGVVERRIAELSTQNETLERRVHSFEDHSQKVKVAYDKLNGMYINICGEFSAMQLELVAEKKKARDSAAAAAAAATAAMASTPVDIVERDDDEKNILVEELEDVRRQLREMNGLNESVHGEYNRVRTHAETLQDRLDGTTAALSESQKEVEELFAETEELKGQRDLAMKRALSRGKSNNFAPAVEAAGKELKAVEEEMKLSGERFKVEQERLARRIGELETENGDLKEDIDYEKAEKDKARTERDRVRETTRGLERRTSQAVRVTDELHSVQRKLSTHQMKDQDQRSVIAHLEEEVKSLRRERDEARRVATEQVLPNGVDDVKEMLSALVVTKLALAEAKGEKQRTEFALNQLRKKERVVQDRLGERASRLQSELQETTKKLERVQREKSKTGDQLTEFNDLGSDVDY